MLHLSSAMGPSSTFFEILKLLRLSSSSLFWSSLLFAHCRNTHGIAPRVATHVLETAAYVLISSSDVVHEGGSED